jgi:hypothetical protein
VEKENLSQEKKENKKLKLIHSRVLEKIEGVQVKLDYDLATIGT